MLEVCGDGGTMPTNTAVGLRNASEQCRAQLVLWEGRHPCMLEACPTYFSHEPHATPNRSGVNKNAHSDGGRIEQRVDNSTRNPCANAWLGNTNEEGGPLCTNRRTMRLRRCRDQAPAQHYLPIAPSHGARATMPIGAGRALKTPLAPPKSPN